MHTHYHSESQGGPVEIEGQKPFHLRAVAKKMRRQLEEGSAHPSHSAELADHIDLVAERKEQEFEAAYLAEHGVPYVKKADRPK
jgi:hypothetical protein